MRKECGPPISVHKDALLIGLIHDFETIWRHEFTRAAGRFASCMRFEPQHIGMTGVDQGASPVLQRDIFNVDPGVESRARFVALLIDDQPAVALPDAGLTRAALPDSLVHGQPRRGRGARLCRVAVRPLQDFARQAAIAAKAALEPVFDKFAH